MELKDFKYRDQFNITGKLSQTLSTIISKKEGTNYICGILKFNSKAHKEWINKVSEDSSHVPTLSSYKYLDETFIETKDFVKKEKPYSYFVVIEQETYRFFSQITSAFSKKENVDRVLSILCPISQEYNGVLDATELKEKYPYLETFFDHLDTWRMSNNRATLEDSVIDEAAAKTLVPKEYKKQ